MDPAALAIMVLGLMAAGAAGAGAFTRRMSRNNGRKVVLMAAVAAWVILFGMLPFFAFSLYATRTASPAGPPSGWTALALNLIPFTLLASPLVGFAHGMRASRTRS